MPAVDQRPSAPKTPRVELGACVAVLCVLGAILPFAAGFAARGEGAPPTLVVSGVFGAMALGLLWSVLAPLRAAARLLNGPQSPGYGAIWPSMILKQIQEITQEVGDLKRDALAHPVTQLPTRAVFVERVAATLGPHPARGVVGVVRMMDYDALAAFDQQAADTALVSFATRLRKAAARHRLIAQIDRDRFVIWFPDAGDASELQALAYVLSQEIAEGQVQLAPQIEVGAAVCPRDGANAEMLLSHALGAMAAGGRSALGSLAPSTMSTQARERFALSQEVRRALKRNQLSLRYQPVIDLGESRVVGAEALLRWTHPDLGAVSPSEFVPLLEQSGQMQEVGLWVLNTACREARAWRDRGLGELKMAVNLSQPRGDGFLGGAAAVESTFQDIHHHLICTVAGSEGAVAATLQALDPAAIEESLKGRSFVLRGRAGEAWNRYVELHAELRGAAGADPLPQNAFREAYEERDALLHAEDDMP